MTERVILSLNKRMGLNMKKLDGQINLQKEFEALFEFIELRWVTKLGLRELLEKVWSKGLELYADTAESEYRVSNKIMKLSDNEDNYINSSLTEAEESVASRSHPYIIFSRALFILSCSGLLKQPDGLRYYDIERIMKGLLAEYPECKQAKPKGWSAFKKNYTDYAGMDEYNEKADKDVFKGTDIEPDDRSFVLKISLPQVMYDDVCQGNKAIVVLMMAVVDHARKCISHNNALNFLKDLEKVEAYFLSLKDVAPMPFSVSFENVTDNKILVRALEKAADDFLTEEDFKERVIQREEYLALPENEKRQRKADAALRMQEILKKAMNK